MQLPWNIYPVSRFVIERQLDNLMLLEWDFDRVNLDNKARFAIDDTARSIELIHRMFDRFTLLYSLHQILVTF